MVPNNNDHKIEPGKVVHESYRIDDKNYDEDDDKDDRNDDQDHHNNDNDDNVKKASDKNGGTGIGNG